MFESSGQKNRRTFRSGRSTRFCGRRRLQGVDRWVGATSSGLYRTLAKLYHSFKDFIYLLAYYFSRPLVVWCPFLVPSSLGHCSTSEWISFKNNVSGLDSFLTSVPEIAPNNNTSHSADWIFFILQRLLFFPKRRLKLWKSSLLNGI